MPLTGGLRIPQTAPFCSADESGQQELATEPGTVSQTGAGPVTTCNGVMPQAPGAMLSTPPAEAAAALGVTLDSLQLWAAVLLGPRPVGGQTCGLEGSGQLGQKASSRAISEGSCVCTASGREPSCVPRQSWATSRGRGPATRSCFCKISQRRLWPLTGSRGHLRRSMASPTSVAVTLLPVTAWGWYVSSMNCPPHGGTVTFWGTQTSPRPSLAAWRAHRSWK